jgi:hypothetical protein
MTGFLPHLSEQLPAIGIASKYTGDNILTMPSFKIALLAGLIFSKCMMGEITSP